MELIKDVIRQFYPLLMLSACVGFVMYVFFSANYNGGEGVFENTGNIFVTMVGEGGMEQDRFIMAEEMLSSYIPEILYNSGAKKVGDVIAFKDLFLVKKEDGIWVCGSQEEGFAIHLTDIKSPSGNSVLVQMTSEEMERMEEIPTSFIYDREKDMLHILGSGIYIVELKVYGNNGEIGRYEFKLPVDVY